MVRGSDEPPAPWLSTQTFMNLFILAKWNNSLQAHCVANETSFFVAPNIYESKIVKTYEEVFRVNREEVVVVHTSFNSFSEDSSFVFRMMFDYKLPMVLASIPKWWCSCSLFLIF